MAFRYNPRFKAGPFTFGKRGVSLRTGIPGLTFRTNYSDLGGSSTTADSGTDSSSISPFQPTQTVRGLIWSLAKFIVLVGIAILFWSAFSFWIGVAVAAIALAAYTYPALFHHGYTYGLKKQAVYKRDRRFKAGERFEGYAMVTDFDNKIYYTDEEHKLMRIKGTVQLVFLGTMLMLVYPEKSRLADANDQPDAPLTIKNLSVGSDLNAVRKNEKGALRSISSDWYSADDTKYAGIGGDIDYWLDGGKIDYITFKPTESDTAAYGKLASLLFAKYGPARDSTSSMQRWKNDSLKLELSRSTGRAQVRLEKIGWFD